MKVGVMSVLFGDRPLDKALEYLKSLGITELEVGAGGCPGKAHCDPKELLGDENKLIAFKNAFAKYGMHINALACHGNPVHPDKAIAKQYHDDFENAVLLAEKLNVKKIIGFSGCPGDCPDSKYPNWAVIAWPDDFLKILDYQWNDVLIPYWKKEAAFCKSHGIEKIALEMHPGFCVYTPETLMKLRNAVGDIIGANLDPSHLIWQGIDPVAAIRYLNKAIYHVHAKDTKIDKSNTAINGVLDTHSYGDELNRSWIFRTVGYGNDYTYWKDFVSNLRLVGYDDVLSIEHEDSLMTNEEGLEKAINFLNEVNISATKPCGMYWA
ncbi:MAG: sugar phosphate isomerase/epimerase [Clostridia bacterium]